MKPKHRTRLIEEDHEGYIASNSDNNIEFMSRNKSKVRKDLLTSDSGDFQKHESKLSHSSSSENETHLPQASKLWENLEGVGLKNTDSDSAGSLDNTSDRLLEEDANV